MSFFPSFLYCGISAGQRCNLPSPNLKGFCPHIGRGPFRRISCSSFCRTQTVTSTTKAASVWRIWDAACRKRGGEKQWRNLGATRVGRCTRGGGGRIGSRALFSDNVSRIEMALKQPINAVTRPSHVSPFRWPWGPISSDFGKLLLRPRTTSSVALGINKREWPAIEDHAELSRTTTVADFNYEFLTDAYSRSLFSL